MSPLTSDSFCLEGSFPPPQLSSLPLPRLALALSSISLSHSSVSPVLGLASSFLNCQDHSSIAKLSCHPHLLSLPLPGRLLPGGSGQHARVGSEATESLGLGCGGALNHQRRDWPSAPRQARCEMSGPRSENDSFPLHRGRGIPPTVSTKRAASRRGGAGPVGRQGRIDVPSINPRRAVAGLSSHRALCVCGCENLCA